jgi:hypothetical protein
VNGAGDVSTPYDVALKTSWLSSVTVLALTASISNTSAVRVPACTNVAATVPPPTALILEDCNDVTVILSFAPGYLDAMLISYSTQIF